uniref:Uncharacterized protein n=1 Tax=Cacopsylla melanoneura TaxID=428564 RepID=A0A8D8QTD0_9HEMI
MVTRVCSRRLRRKVERNIVFGQNSRIILTPEEGVQFRPRIIHKVKHIDIVSEHIVLLDSVFNSVSYDVNAFVNNILIIEELFSIVSQLLVVHKAGRPFHFTRHVAEQLEKEPLHNRIVEECEMLMSKKIMQVFYFQMIVVKYDILLGLFIQFVIVFQVQVLGFVQNQVSQIFFRIIVDDLVQELFLVWR